MVSDIHQLLPCHWLDYHQNSISYQLLRLQESIKATHEVTFTYAVCFLALMIFHHHRMFDKLFVLGKSVILYCHYQEIFPSRWFSSETAYINLLSYAPYNRRRKLKASLSLWDKQAWSVIPILICIFVLWNVHSLYCSAYIGHLDLFNIYR